MFILASEMRVGSRWLHRVLSEAIDMKLSPELGTMLHAESLFWYWKEGRIPKTHSIAPSNLVRRFPDAKVIGMVRNPRDRYVSLAFRSDKAPQDIPVQDRIQIILDSPEHRKSTILILKEYMSVGLHITQPTCHKHPYCWLDYADFHKDPILITHLLLDFIDMDGDAERGVERWTFDRMIDLQNKAINEFNEDMFFCRRGIVGEWKEHFTQEQIKETADEQALYEKLYSEAIFDPQARKQT